MRTDSIPLVITVQKVNKTFKCIDQFGKEHKIDKEDLENGIPEWRYRKALKGNFKLIKKYDKNNVVHWKKYRPEKDGDILLNEIETSN
jgi:hypothetical protein